MKYVKYRSFNWRSFKCTVQLSVSRRIAMIRLQLPCKHQSGGFRPDVQQVAYASRNKRVEWNKCPNYCTRFRYGTRFSLQSLGRIDCIFFGCQIGGSRELYCFAIHGEDLHLGACYFSLELGCDWIHEECLQQIPGRVTRMRHASFFTFRPCDNWFQVKC